MTPKHDRQALTSFIDEWNAGGPGARTWAVAKRLAPAILFVVFMYFFTTFAGR